MNITDLYELFIHHHCVSIDSRNCPTNSLFLHSGENGLTGINLLKLP